MKNLKIIVVGTIASDPYAGMAWMNMQIVLGLKRLGHQVYYFETSSTWPYNPLLHTRVNNADYAVPYLKKITASFGVENWAYRCSFSKGKEWFGMKKNTAEDILANADLILNMAGATRFAEENLKVGRLVYYGTDPVYHEIKYAEGDGYTRSIIDEHDDVVSYGENIGNEDCSIPPLPQLKAKTRQPVVLDLWESVGPTKKEFTTVGNWKQSGRDLDFNGKTYYWSKHYEFLKFIDLPKRMSQPIELATNLSKPRTILDFSDTSDPESIGIAEDDYSMLISNGWFLADGPSFTTDPWTYRNYILQSRGEFTCSKDQNVRLRSGWFSERSACYLAASRPVVTQDTGFGCVLPTGEGLFAFTTMDEILGAFDAINSNYKKHSKAAFEIANEYFKAEKVMQKLLSDLGL